MIQLSPDSLLGSGRTAEVYAWRDKEIIKLFYTWCSPQWVQQEIKIDQIVWPMPLPTPRLIDSVEIDGRLGIIYERVLGPSMLTVVNRKPWLLFQMARQFAELHTTIHQQSGKDLSLLLRPPNKALDKDEALTPALEEMVHKIVATLPDGVSLCHCDFHPDQVLLTNDGPVIIDWMTAQQGHPLADVARTNILLMVGQVPYAGPMMRTFINFWRGLFRRAYLAHYFRLNPQFNRDSLQNWMVAAAVYRLAEAIPGEKEPLLHFLNSALESSSS